MYSYIYADNTGPKGLNSFYVSKNKHVIETLAMSNIRAMINDHGDPNNTLFKEIIATLDEKKVDKSIDLWNKYASTELQYHITYHKINQFDVTE